MRELRESFSDEAEIATCDHVPYFGQKDQWSCGYQNLRMILGSLYRMILSTDKEIMLPRNWISFCTRRCSAPSVEILQLMLEEAWRSGFDVEGGGHFGNRVFGTPQWIGATEAHALLSSGSATTSSAMRIVHLQRTNHTTARDTGGVCGAGVLRELYHLCICSMIRTPRLSWVRCAKTTAEHSSFVSIPRRIRVAPCRTATSGQ